MSAHEMELGNMLFGNSRGEVPIPREVSWEGPWQEFCDELKIDWYGYPSDGCAIPETKWSSEWNGVDTDVFRVMSYDWNAECTCGIGGHSEACRLVQPNFLYKPTGFSINWYKYPFRDSYMTPGISAKEWRKIVRHCIESASP